MNIQSRKYQIIFTIVTLIFSLTGFDCSAQKIRYIKEEEALISASRHSLLISPFALVAGNYKKLRLRYQYTLKRTFALGSDFKYFYSTTNYPGYQLSPFVKVFTGKTNHRGFYVYLNGVYGENKGLPDVPNKYYACYGGGMGIGGQFLIGANKDCLIDIAFGLKYVGSDAVFDDSKISDDYEDYFIIGPAALFDGILAFGVRF